MFGGYNEYNDSKIEKIYLSLPLFIRSAIAKVIKPLPYFKGKHTLIKYGKDISKRYYNKTEMFLPEEIPEIIESKDRQKAGKTLPAHGLYLVKVEY